MAAIPSPFTEIFDSVSTGLSTVGAHYKYTRDLAINVKPPIYFWIPIQSDFNASRVIRAQDPDGRIFWSRNVEIKVVMWAPETLVYGSDTYNGFDYVDSIMYPALVTALREATQTNYEPLVPDYSYGQVEFLKYGYTMTHSFRIKSIMREWNDQTGIATILSYTLCPTLTTTII